MYNILNFDSNIIESIIYPIIVEYYQNSEITTKKIHIDIDNNKVWKGGPKFVIKQNIKFIEKTMKFLKVNKLWNKIIFKKIKNICLYVADEKVYNKIHKERHKSVDVPLINDYIFNEELIFTNLLEPNFIDKFIENNNNPNNLILDIDCLVKNFSISTRNECLVSQRRYPMSLSNKYFMKKNDILCIKCNKSNCVEWANKIRKYIVYGFPKKLRDRIINIWKVQQSCYKCKCIEVCLEHQMDRDLLELYNIWGNISSKQYNNDGIMWHKPSL